MDASNAARLAGGSALLVVLAALSPTAGQKFTISLSPGPVATSEAITHPGTEPSGSPRSETTAAGNWISSPHAFVGMWVTADGDIRQELRSDGRYEEARGAHEKAYTGRYTVDGDHIDYNDDTGFTATGDVRDGVLYHEHLVLYREGDSRINNPGTKACPAMITEPRTEPSGRAVTCSTGGLWGVQ